MSWNKETTVIELEVPQRPRDGYFIGWMCCEEEKQNYEFFAKINDEKVMYIRPNRDEQFSAPIEESWEMFRIKVLRWVYFPEDRDELGI